MSVSEPGTWTIFTHVVLLCVLKASVMCFRLTESGGVCEVQNVARFVPELQPASGGAVEVLPPPHAASTMLMKTNEAFQPRLPSNDMAITSVIEAPRSPRLLPDSPLPETGARARRRGAANYSIAHYCPLAARCQLGRSRADRLVLGSGVGNGRPRDLPQAVS